MARTGARRRRRAENTSVDAARLLGDAGLARVRSLRDAVADDETGVLVVAPLTDGDRIASPDVELLFLTSCERGELEVPDELHPRHGEPRPLPGTGDRVIRAEMVFRRDHDRLADTLDHVVGRLAFSGRVQRFPLLDNRDLTFLHRLRSGLVLAGDETVDRFREDCHSGSLPLYLSVMYLVLARESLEDARGVPAETPGLVEFVCYEVIERSVLALAAAGGFTSPRKRLVMSWIAGLPTGHEHAGLLTQMRDSLLDRSIVPAAQRVGLVQECRRYFERVHAALVADEVRRTVVDEIFSSISYAE